MLCRVNFAYGQVLWLKGLRGWSEVVSELRQGNAFVFLQNFWPEVGLGFVADSCAYLLSFMQTPKMFLSDNFGQLSARAAKVVGSWCSCGSLTGGKSMSRRAPGNPRQQWGCSLLRLMETNHAWGSDGIVVTLVMLTTNTFASILAWFWEEKNHCALTDFCSCLFN